MTTAKDLRSWLMTQPRPTIVRLQVADGQVHELQCAGQPWARLGESCAAMDPVTIFALDAQAKLLRVAKVADIADDVDSVPEDDAVAPAAAPAQMQRDDPRAMLAVLDKFGTLLAGAYEHSNSVAFAKMVEVVSLFSQATAQMQRELVHARLEVRRMERDVLDEALEKADAAGDGDMMRQFIGSYFQGQASRMAESATSAVAGKPNGKSAAPTPPANGD